MKLSIGKKIFLSVAVLSLFALPSFATNVTLNWGNGQTATVDVPDDLLSIVNDNKSTIEAALTEYNVSSEQVTSAVSEFSGEYESYLKDFNTLTPYTDAVNGLNDFCSSLNDTLPNTQTLQNVWAESWIGMLIPNVKFGFGVNAGVATLDITSLLDVADALAIDTSDIKDFTKDYDNKLVFPTVAADLRIGGIVLPFDLGLSFVTFDTRDWSQIDDGIKPCAFDYFTIGSDLRWRLLDLGGKFFHIRASASGGFYHTKGGLEVLDDDIGAGASMDFKSTTLFAGAQFSAKALCFVPFLGGRLMLTKSSVDWKANANWDSILGASTSTDSAYADVLKWNILPTNFSGGSSSSWGVRPQIYGGLGIDLFVLDITMSGSYDLVKDVLGGAVSVRISI